VVLVVDDIHAADNATTAILHSVARKLEDTRVQLVLTGRTNELRLSEAPWAFSSDASIRTLRALEVEPLPREAAERLVDRIAGKSNHELPVDRILQASGGNPLAIELLTREWEEHGAASLLSELEALNTRPVPAIGIPRAIAAIFDRQSQRLDQRTRAVLDLAAILGRRLCEVNLYSAVELSAGQAAEALSRLRDERYLRDVSGDLEFRNELIRAQAYYAIAGATRQHLHRKVAQLLTQNHSRGDKTICLEIAWHHLRGGDVGGAIPFAIEGAEAVLSVGAPHGAQEILEAVLATEQQLDRGKELRLLLAKALVDQSKGSAAVPIIEQLSQESLLDSRDRAEIAMLRATAEFQSNRESGERYTEAARAALEAAKNTGDGTLIAKALFECARAGAEQGISSLIGTAEEEIDALAKSIDFRTVPMAILTKAFCRFSLGYPRDALTELRRYLELNSPNANAAELAFLYSGMGIASHFVGQMNDALNSHLAALSLAKRVGDDARISIIAGNLCTIYMNRADYDESIRYGLISVQHGESAASSGLLISYTNLIDPYMLIGRENSALECLEKAREWLGPERRWKLHLTFLIEAASFALMRHNTGLALDFISQLESVARGREDAVLMPGVYWKMRTFKMAHTGRMDDALAALASQGSVWKRNAIFHYMDIVAARAWLETRERGVLTPETTRELRLFDDLDLRGRKQLLTLQGFLQPSANLGYFAKNSTNTPDLPTSLHC
jgi:tetratricopeptide (TPR) repeat protein